MKYKVIEEVVIEEEGFAGLMIPRRILPAGTIINLEPVEESIKDLVTKDKMFFQANEQINIGDVAVVHGGYLYLARPKDVDDNPVEEVKVKAFLPEEGIGYFFIDTALELNDDVFEGFSHQVTMCNAGNCFRTKEDAQIAQAKVIELFNSFK